MFEFFTIGAEILWNARDISLMAGLMVYGSAYTAITVLSLQLCSIRMMREYC